MPLNKKSEHKTLYFCAQSACRVINFVPDPNVGEVCPGCKALGVLVREPVGSRTGIRR